MLVMVISIEIMDPTNSRSTPTKSQAMLQTKYMFFLIHTMKELNGSVYQPDIRLVLVIT
jgi:hypothetical protein